MSERTCIVEGCEKPKRAAGWCAMHYYRVKKHGSPDATVRKPRRGMVCVIEGCERERYSGKYGWCSKHYQQWWAENSVRDACDVAECQEPKIAKGFCAVHAARMRRTGTTDLVGRRKGADNYMWGGDDVSYGAVHLRLRRSRGPAKELACMACGGAASQWAYDHCDPDEKQSDRGPYSTNLDHYQALCTPCHKMFDLERLGKKSLKPRSRRRWKPRSS